MALKRGMVDLGEYGLTLQIPEEQYKTLQENFALFDRDGGGEVSPFPETSPLSAEGSRTF